MGQTMKLANNLLSATAMAISSEAIVMGVKAGLDPQVMVEVINSGSGRNTATQDKFPRSVLPRSFDYGFATGLMYKDVKLCLEEAEALGVQMWVGAAVRQLWQFANSELGPGSDFTAIVTQMHSDHAGNFDLLANATYHIQEREMAYCTGRCMCHPALRNSFEADDVAAMVRRVFAGRVRFHDGVGEIAPGLSVHAIGGHTMGLQSVRGMTRRGFAVLAADATPLYAPPDQGRLV